MGSGGYALRNVNDIPYSIMHRGGGRVDEGGSLKSCTVLVTLDVGYGVWNRPMVLQGLVSVPDLGLGVVQLQSTGRWVLMTCELGPSCHGKGLTHGEV